MSLTRFLKDKEVKAKFKKYLNKPRIKYSKEIKVPYKSNQYTQIGIAFDYLMQLYLKRLHPEIEDEVKFLIREGIPYYHGEIKKDALANYSLLEESVKKYYETKGLQMELIIHLLHISPFDIAYRTGMYQYLDNKYKIDTDDIFILEELYKLLEKQNFKDINYLKLNPDFDIFSKYISGADADLIIDDSIIDIKTTMKKGVLRKEFNQVFGYYLLYQLSSMNIDKPKIKNIGVYKARYGETILYPIEDIISEDMLNELLNWFVIKIAEFYNYKQEKIDRIINTVTNYVFKI